MRVVIRQTLTNLRDAALSTLYPTTCRVCGEMVESWDDGVVCAKCWEETLQSLPDENLCAKCGLTLQSLPAQNQITGRRCGCCDDLAFNYARACGPYEGALRESVIRLKTHPHLPPRLREMMRLTFANLDVLNASDSIIPIPLHPIRLAQRTFNQAEIIAEALSGLTRLRVDRASVIRVRQTPKHRAGMGARERGRSLAGAFRVRAPRLIEGRVVLIVDDVMTTSSTAHEISLTLLEGGAREINVLTLARAMSEFTGVF